VAILLSFALAAAPACMTAVADAAVAAAPVDGPAVRIVSVIDGDTASFDPAVDGSREVRLVGIQAPKLPLGRAGFQTWPLADEAQAALAALVAGRQVRLVAPGSARDRHGRLLAHGYREDGLWLQGEMLRLGLARVYTFADNRSLAAEMLALEQEARARRRGIWSHPFYAIRDAGDVDERDIGTFQIVEGAVQTAQRVRDRVYLNFGSDWRRDFTVQIPAKALPMFRAAGVDPLALEGVSVRVRGWIDSYNGPVMEISHPEAIERADAIPG
jgi:endonuclease YncB( thermonuclease family)